MQGLILQRAMRRKSNIEALLGGMDVPRLNFKDVAISEGSHVAVVIS